MNPGPAPRPPTDRPRLNLMPSTVNVPGNMTQLSLQSSSVRSSSTYTGNDTFSPALSRTTTLTESIGNGGVAIIKEGHAKCKEGLLWKNRYLVLRAFQLDFQKGQDGKVSMSIQLRDVTSVSRSESTPLSFEITRVINPGTGTGPVLANRDLPQKTILCQLKSDDEIYDWIDVIYNRCPGMGGVSNPTNFSHRVHVGFDPVNGSFVGLPTEWERLLTASAITKEDYQKHPQAVIEVLEFYSDITKRNENPDVYSSLTPTPPAMTSAKKQLGHGGGGASIAPPRPSPPARTGSQPNFSQQPQRYMQDASRSQNGTPVSSQRNVSGAERVPDLNQKKMGMDHEMRHAMEEEARKIKAAKEQRERDRAWEEEEKNRKEQEAYNASIPKTRSPLAKQEIGGYGGSPEADSSSSRYNPTRNPPPAPIADRSRQQSQGSLRQVPTQRQGPSSNGMSPSAQAPPRAPYAHQKPQSRDQSPSSAPGSSRALQRPEQQLRQLSPSSRPSPNSNQRNQSPQTHARTNGVSANGANHVQPSTRPPAPLQLTPTPPNVSTRQPTGAPPGTSGDAADPVKQAEIALTSKGPAATRQKEVRMSSMTESQVMEKLKQVVSKDDPQLSYTKQRKIGQGASGSVYLARINDNAASPVARRLHQTQSVKPNVAIKQMDLRNQPRKELIVNEIIVMKESSHPNIVNFLDSFLQEGNNELWVVMEYMEGGALTDVIDNNPHITEPQISTICNEVYYACCATIVYANTVIDLQRPSSSSQPKYHSSRYQKRQCPPRRSWQRKNQWVSLIPS